MMLVLSRKKGERILIGPDIELTVMDIVGRRVRLAVHAPLEVPIHREEVRRRIHEADPRKASTTSGMDGLEPATA
jgi:carbon storage regulator